MARVRGKHPSPSTAYYPDVVPSVKFSDPHVFPVTPEKLLTDLPCRGSGGGQRVQEHPPSTSPERAPQLARDREPLKDATPTQAEPPRTTDRWSYVTDTPRERGSSPPIPKSAHARSAAGSLASFKLAPLHFGQTRTTGIGGRSANTRVNAALTLTPCTSAPTPTRLPVSPMHRQ